LVNVYVEILNQFWEDPIEFPDGFADLNLSETQRKYKEQELEKTYKKKSFYKFSFTTAYRKASFLTPIITKGTLTFTGAEDKCEAKLKIIVIEQRNNVNLNNKFINIENRGIKLGKVWNFQSYVAELIIKMIKLILQWKACFVEWNLRTPEKA